MTRLLLVSIISIALPISCGRTTTKSSADKKQIDITIITAIEILKVSGPPDSIKSVWFELTEEQVKSFVEKWNSSKNQELRKYLPTFEIVIFSKNDSTRKFRVNGQFIKEDNDWCFDFKDKEYFEKLYSNAVLKESKNVDTTTIYYSTTANLKSRFIPDQVFQMTNLRHLTIQGMDCDHGDTTTCWMIKEIPKQISNLKKLETLQLNVNAIRTIPEEISALQNLKSLDLTDNSTLSDLDNITTLTTLEQLTVFGCGLTKLPEDIGQLKRLKYLGLTGNNLDNVELERIKKELPTCKIVYSK